MLLGGFLKLKSETYTSSIQEVGPDLVSFLFLIEFRVKEKEVRMILRQGINKHIYSLTEIGSLLRRIETSPLFALQTVSVYFIIFHCFECINLVLKHAG